MLINQISVFIQNEKGRLSSITEVLRDNNVDIRALSLADTTDFGILRLIVNDPDLAVKALKDSGHTVSITKVIGVIIEDKPGGLCVPLKALSDNNVSVEYMYAYIGGSKDKAVVIIRVDNNEMAQKVLESSGIPMISPEEAYQF